jgi:Ca2+-binding EF-hand superfamily protein
MRFRGMDRNGDGVITRDEWRGNDQSFRQHDRNGDGIISGDELRGNRGD